MIWPFNRKPKTPEELESRISAKAARRAAKIAAKGKAQTRLDEAKEGQAAKSLAVRTIECSSNILFVAAILMILAGYWIDILFYTQQSDSWFVAIAFFALAIALRSVAAFGDVILHATKPDKEDDDEDPLGIQDLARRLIRSEADRRWLRRLWVMSVIGCAFATMSFFSAGHETRQAEQQAIATTETAITSSKKERIDALKVQKDEAREARDTAITSADRTIAEIKDNVEGLSASDNETIRAAEASKRKANEDYNAALADLNRQINSINAEQETELRATTSERVGSQPFLTVYTFLARFIWSVEGWTIAGALFFALLFELLCAKLLAIVSAIMKVLKRLTKAIQMREAADEMHARISLQRMRSNIELDEIRLKGAAAQERAVADIELAKREREVEKARARADALRDGVPWIDPDELLEAMADAQRAEQEARIRKLNERAEKLRAGEVDPDAETEPSDPPEAPDAEDEAQPTNDKTAQGPEKEEEISGAGDPRHNPDFDINQEVPRQRKPGLARAHYDRSRKVIRIPMDDVVSAEIQEAAE